MVVTDACDHVSLILAAGCIENAARRGHRNGQVMGGGGMGEEDGRIRVIQAAATLKQRLAGGRKALTKA